VYGNSLVRYKKLWSMLVMDAFHDHFSDRIVNRFWKKNTDLVIISSGIPSQLQSLGVSRNKPFKQLIHEHYDAWLNEDNHILTPSGKSKRSPASIIVEWLSKLGK
jgi:hypothetical protein